MISGKVHVLNMLQFKTSKELSMKKLFLPALFLTALVQPYIAFADCSAKATSKSAKIAGTGDTFVTFDVQGKPCSKGCNGYIDYRIHYIDAKGNKHFYARAAKWSSDAGEPVEASKDGYESHCNSRNLGPCDVMGVEITDTSCYD